MPLADMLTNTVGIILFVLAFTVLTAAGVSVPKRLPIEQDTKAAPLYALCLKDGVYPVDLDLVDKLPRANGMLDLEAARDWVRRGDGATLDDAYFTLKETVKLDEGAGSIGAEVSYTPKAGAGIPKAKLAGDGNGFQVFLAAHKPSEHFLYFMVVPDGIDTFFHARDAGLHHGYQTGWSPVDAPGILTVNLTGGGGDGDRFKPQ